MKALIKIKQKGEQCKECKSCAIIKKLNGEDVLKPRKCMCMPTLSYDDVFVNERSFRRYVRREDA